MSLSTFALPLLLTLSSALPLESRQSGPSVTFQDGTVTGSTMDGVDTFNGIPFAQPPVGPLRLKPPQPLNSSLGTIDGTAMPKSCPQFNNILNQDYLPPDVIDLVLNSPIVQTASGASEDCLTLNVQRPSGVAEDAKLPVLFWIYGGGFEAGSTGMYDGSSFIQRSVDMGQPIMYVAVNYRLGGFGFLAGSELADDGSTNLGLRDQRLGLQWVADNIANFGGDPDKVTIWGESAGAISVNDQTLINRGDNTYNGKALFRGAMMSSGSIVSATDVRTPAPQRIYDSVVQNAGCSDAADSLTCLRQVDYTTFLNAVTAVPGIFSYRSLDLSYLPRPDASSDFFPTSPETAVMNGDFTKVPIIVGDQEDEGTLFSLVQSNITTNKQLIQYLASYFPANPNAVSDVKELVSFYPNQPLLGQPAGSPFRTGGLNNVYPQFKRLAAILGDLTFTLTRRTYLEIVSSQVKSWSFLATYFHGTPVLGTFHGNDILVAYGTLGDMSVPTTTYQTYFINFVNDLDPNGGGVEAPLIQWPQWTESEPQLVELQAARNTLLTDDFRKNASDFLAANGQSFRV